MLTSGWITATIADGASITGEIDLGNHYNRVLIIMPDLDTDTSANVQVCNTSGGTFANLHNPYLATPAVIAIADAMASVVDIAGARYLKIDCTTNQTGAKTISIIAVPW